MDFQSSASFATSTRYNLADVFAHGSEPRTPRNRRPRAVPTPTKPVSDSSMPRLASVKSLLSTPDTRSRKRSPSTPLKNVSNINTTAASVGKRKVPHPASAASASSPCLPDQVSSSPLYLPELVSSPPLPTFSRQSLDSATRPPDSTASVAPMAITVRSPSPAVEVSISFDSSAPPGYTEDRDRLPLPSMATPPPPPRSPKRLQTFVEPPTPTFAFCAREPHSPTLPAAWTAQHDRAICMLDARDHALPVIIAKLRRAFPGLPGLLTPAMIDRRLRQLDQVVELDYWRHDSCAEGAGDEDGQAFASSQLDDELMASGPSMTEALDAAHPRAAALSPTPTASSRYSSSSDPTASAPVPYPQILSRDASQTSMRAPSGQLHETRRFHAGYRTRIM